MLLKPLVIRRPLPHEHAERRRLRRVRRRREVAEVALLAGRDRRVALRAYGLLRLLTGHLLLAERRELGARERRHEAHHVVDLRLGETEALHAAVEVGVRDAALVGVV